MCGYLDTTKVCGEEFLLVRNTIKIKLRKIRCKKSQKLLSFLTKSETGIFCIGYGFKYLLMGYVCSEIGH